MNNYIFERLIIFNLLIVQIITVKIAYAYYGSTQTHKSFQFNDHTHFYIHLDELSWYEANAICTSVNMSLAVIDTNEKAKFISLKLSEMVQELNNLWIGGFRTDRNRWAWLDSSKIFPEEQYTNENSNFLYPPWLNDYEPNNDRRNCLAIGSSWENNPIFIDLICNQLRPFICESELRPSTKPIVAKTFSTDNIQYILYHGHLSWYSAVAFCRHQGYTLAIINDMITARRVANAMIKSRPNIENMWIGAQFVNSKWIWIENGQNIKHILLNSTTHLLKTIPFALTNGVNKEQGCGIIEQRLWKNPIIKNSKCYYRRNFLCMKRNENDRVKLNNHVIRVRGKKYSFYDIKATWFEALQTCQKESNKSTMVTLNSESELRFIIQAMVTEKIPFKHIWLAGKKDELSKWVWVDQKGYKVSEISMDPISFLPWYNNEMDSMKFCLNLDRYNFVTPMIYGLQCNETQATICESEQDPIEITLNLNLTSLKISKIPSLNNYFTVVDNCERNFGKLWQPNFTNSPLNTLKNLLEAEYNLDEYTIHIDAGQYNAMLRKWIRYNNFGHKEVFELDIDNEPNDGDCLSSEYSKLGDKLLAINCSKYIQSQMVCEMACPFDVIKVESNDSNWYCDINLTDNWEYKLLDTRCIHKCPDGKALLGPQQFVCKYFGWYELHGFKPEHSVCEDLHDSLINLVQVQPEVVILVFVVDATIKHQEFQVTKLFIAAMLNKYYAQLESIIVVNNSGNNYTIKEYSIKDGNCDSFAKNVSLLSDGLLKSFRDFQSLATITKEYTKQYTQNTTSYVFITNGPCHIKKLQKEVMELKTLSTVFAIGTSFQVKAEELIELASISNVTKRSQNILFNNINDFQKAVEPIYKTCTTCSCSLTELELKI